MTKRQYHQGHSAKRHKHAAKPAKDGSNEEVLLADVKQLLLNHTIFEDSEDGKSAEPSSKQVHSLPDKFSEIEVKISELSSTGDGLGLSSTSNHVYVVPFTLPGDRVQAKVITHFPQARYTLADFVKVITPAPQRDDSLALCPYFAKCAGCQIQMLPYDMQLQHKKTIVEKAYSNFSSLNPDIIPVVGQTIGSPLQYGYRTKLTPHFDGPPGSMTRRAKRDPSERKPFDEVPPIGFQLKGTRKIIDIEDCPIGTDAVREGMRAERRRISEEFGKYTKGATILLRESTLRKPTPAAYLQEPRPGNSEDANTNPKRSEVDSSDSVSRAVGETNKPPANGSYHGSPSYIEEKTCITDQRAISIEYIDDFEFKNAAGAFFQNNNSILPRFTAYIRDRIIPPSAEGGGERIKYLIDAYCGSGLFTITLSSLFASSMGIDIVDASIISARANATANNTLNASFMTADASKLFEQVTYSPEKTAVILDPPRKGCDDSFLQQLLKFGPQRIVYVSCNVHTQARDVGVLVEGKEGCRYDIESLQGFDFFPQTGHVEGVAVLSRSQLGN